MPRIIDFDWEKFNAILEFGSSLKDAADIMDCSISTIDNKIKHKHDITFKEYRDKKMSKLRNKLLSKQIEVAMSGNVSMLIWLGKNLLGQSDTPLQDLEEVDYPEIV